MQAVLGEFERQTPRRLARGEDQPIGAAGLVTYEVTRGRLRLAASNGKLSASLPVQIDLRVCKPIAGLCIGYGSCTPEYEVHASLDLSLDREHEIGDVKLSEKVKRGCTIGMDVTEHVTQVVREQLSRAEREAKRQLPSVAPWVDRAIAELTRPSELGPGACVALSPAEILLDGPEVTGDRLELSVGLRGALESASCESPPHRGRGLAVTKQERGAAPTLFVPELVSTQTLREELERGLAQAKSAELELTLGRLLLDSDALVVELHASGEVCGTLWARARPRVENGSLMLGPVEVENAKLSSAAEERVASALGAALRVRARADDWVARLAIEERASILGTLLQSSTGLELGVTPPRVTQATAMVVPDGVLVRSEVSGLLALSLSQR